MGRQEIERLVEQWCREQSKLSAKQCKQLAPKLTDLVLQNCDLQGRR